MVEVREREAREQQVCEQEGEPALSAKAQGKQPKRPLAPVPAPVPAPAPAPAPAPVPAPAPAPAPVFSIGAQGPPIAALSLGQRFARASLFQEFRDTP